MSAFVITLTHLCQPLLSSCSCSAQGGRDLEELFKRQLLRFAQCRPPPNEPPTPAHVDLPLPRAAARVINAALMTHQNPLGFLFFSHSLNSSHIATSCGAGMSCRDSLSLSQICVNVFSPSLTGLNHGKCLP